MSKRKISYEQSLALERGHQIARANQRRRVAARQTAERAAQERREAERNHQHGWKNWDYVLNYTHEVRECRDCGYAEIRPVRW
jgi:hypothetical protein